MKNGNVAEFFYAQSCKFSFVIQFPLIRRQFGSIVSQKRCFMLNCVSAKLIKHRKYSYGFFYTVVQNRYLLT